MDAKMKWNQKYAARLQESAADPKENQRLSALVSKLPKKGKALDAACGLGGNSLYLAGIGLSVDAFDVSEVAIDYLRNEAGKSGLDITAAEINLDKHTVFLREAYDLAVMTYFLDRDVFPSVKNAVKQGGLFFFETYSGSETNTQISPKYKLQPGELLDIFAGWEILFHQLENGRETLLAKK